MGGDVGLADPARLILTGGSWGGYLSLLGLGTQPDAWTLGIAAVPVADYVTAYHDEMEALKAMDRTLLGGTPDEVPERFEASSPSPTSTRSRPPSTSRPRRRPPLPHPPDRQLRSPPHRPQRHPRGLPLRRGPRLPGRRRTHQTGKAQLDFATRHLPR